MTILSETHASLRFFGDDLDPAELTQKLGQKPSKSRLMGDQIVGKSTGRTRIAKTGSWLLTAEPKAPGDLNAQVAELLDKLTDDLAVWSDLTIRFRGDVNCGLFMDGSNEGFGLSTETLDKLAARGLSIEFDIYDAS